MQQSAVCRAVPCQWYLIAGSELIRQLASPQRSRVRWGILRCIGCSVEDICASIVCEAVQKLDQAERPMDMRHLITL